MSKRFFLDKFTTLSSVLSLWVAFSADCWATRELNLPHDICVTRSTAIAEKRVKGSGIGGARVAMFEARLNCLVSMLRRDDMSAALALVAAIRKRRPELPQSVPSVSVDSVIASVLPSAGRPDPGRVVIVCISGLSGTGGGMSGLAKKLQQELARFGVDANNVFHISWNPDGPGYPLAEPDVDRIYKEIKKRCSAHSLLVLVGHSRGGWAACKVSRFFGSKNEVDLVGLIDPVFGFAGQADPGDVPIALYVKNWYQENGPVNGCSSVMGASDNERLKVVRDWNGSVKTKAILSAQNLGSVLNPLSVLSTLTGKWITADVEQTHTEIDEDQRIWRWIHDYVVARLKQ